MDNENVLLQINYHYLVLRRIEYDIEDDMKESDIVNLHTRIIKLITDVQNLLFDKDDVFYDRSKYCDLVQECIVMRHVIREMLMKVRYFS
jgi:hypothetical protein